MNVKVWKKNHTVRPNFLNEAEEDDMMNTRFAREDERGLGFRGGFSETEYDKKQQRREEQVRSRAERSVSGEEMLADNSKMLGAIYDQAVDIYEARLGKSGTKGLKWHLPEKVEFIKNNSGVGVDLSKVFVPITIDAVPNDNFRYLATQKEIVEMTGNFNVRTNICKLNEAAEEGQTNSYLCAMQFTDPECIKKICDAKGGENPYVLVEIADEDIDTYNPILRELK